MDALGQFGKIDVASHLVLLRYCGAAAPDGRSRPRKVAKWWRQDYSVATQAPAYPASRNFATISRASCSVA